MNIAFADLLFSWPPNGGADVELYHVLSTLHRRGFCVRLFVAHEHGSTERGRVDPESMPFPVVRLDFSRRQLRPKRVCRAFRLALEAWEPDAVILTHGYALKPYLARALGSRYPLAARYYAHELLCARDPFRFKNGAPCRFDYVHTPEACRACAFASQTGGLRRHDYRTWTTDYVAAGAYAAGYPAILRQGLEASKVLLVNNSAIQTQLADVHPDVRVFTPAVDVTSSVPAPALEKGPADKKVILMTGRADDPAKGLDILREAGRILAEKRQDFEIQATHFDVTLSKDWFVSLGWLSHEETVALYEKADVCVVPSLWEEPFGMVALEAMAAGRPVCASSTGGLKDTVVHTETGFLFETGNAKELAKELDILLENGDMRRRMGHAARQRVEKHYGWDSIVRTQYEPLIEELAQ